MNIIKKIFICLLFVFTIKASAQDLFSGSAGRERNFDILHYKIKIDVDIDKKIISGNVTTTLIPLNYLDTLSFDSENIKIKKVSLADNNLKFYTTKKRLNVKFDKTYNSQDTLKVTIDFDCQPRNGIGLTFFSPDSGYPDRRYQCYSQGEAELNHFWFPCYDFPDDRMTSEMIITVKDNFLTISNGKLISVTEDKVNRKKTYHWLQNKEHVTYLISFVVGEYNVIKDKYNEIPMNYYVYQKNLEGSKIIFPKAKEYMKFFENISGEKYPWDKYDQIILQDFFGGMENTSATNLIDNVPDKNHIQYTEKYTKFYSTLIEHELAHQWYGDLITCKNWEHLWLNEGFAEYLPGYDRELTFGKDEAKAYFLDELNSYLAINGKRKMPIVSLNSNNIYPKGALFLNMLRYVIGDKDFFNFFKVYTKKFKNKSIETSDFINCVQEVTKKDLGWFFNQWLYKAGHPYFKITKEYNEKNRNLLLTFEQTQKMDSITGIFRTPIDIEITAGKKKILKNFLIDSLKQTFTIQNIDKPSLISVDPDNNIIKQVEFKKSLDEYINQLKLDRVTGRIEAAEKLQEYCDTKEGFEALQKALIQDKFWKVRAAAAKSLGFSKNEKIVDFLIASSNQNHPLVRTEIIRSLGNFKNNSKVKNAIRSALNDKSVEVQAAAVYACGSVDTSNAFELLKNYIDKESFGNRLQEIIIGTFIRIKENRAIPLFLEYCSKAKSQLARNSCMTGLSAIAGDHPELFDFFVKNLNNSNGYYRRMSVNGLSQIGDKKAIPILEEALKTETNKTVIDYINRALKKFKKED